jgi:hypothetical protein
VEKPRATLGHDAGLKKFDGSSEASTKDSLDVVSSQQILEWKLKFEKDVIADQDFYLVTTG